MARWSLHRLATSFRGVDSFQQGIAEPEGRQVRDAMTTSQNLEKMLENHGKHGDFIKKHTRI